MDAELKKSLLGTAQAEAQAIIDEINNCLELGEINGGATAAGLAELKGSNIDDETIRDAARELADLLDDASSLNDDWRQAGDRKIEAISDALETLENLLDEDEEDDAA